MYFWENLKIISSFYSRCIKSVCEKYGLTQMEYDILMFLTNNPQYDTAADIVRVRALTKSHVSGAVRNLQTRGLLSAYFLDGNRKTIHLRITAHASAVVEDGLLAQEKFRRQLFRGFSPDEGERCRQMYQKICRNACDGLEENDG